MRPKVWRRLRPGETLRDGDQWWNAYDERWIDTAPHLVGGTVWSASLKYRRLE